MYFLIHLRSLKKNQSQYDFFEYYDEKTGSLSDFCLKNEK